MSIFFVSALVSVVLFAAILSIESVRNWTFGIVPPRIHQRLELIVLLIAFGIIFLSVAFALVAYLGARFHPATIVDDPILTMVSSDEFRSAVFGVFFAAIFLHWVSHFHSFSSGPNAVADKNKPEERAEPAAKAQKAIVDAGAEPGAKNGRNWINQKFWVLEGYLLLALFVGGCLGTLQNLLGRLDTVKAGVEGIELSLRASSSQSAKNLPQLVGESVQSGQLNEPNEVALSLLADLGDIIRRDELYLNWTKSDRDAGLRTKSHPPEIKHLENVVDKFIAPLARCQAGLLSVTGSNRLSSRTFAELDEPIHELAHDVAYGVTDGRLNEMLRNITAAYRRVASRTIKEAYIDDILAFRVEDVSSEDKSTESSAVSQILPSPKLAKWIKSKWWLELRHISTVYNDCVDLQHLMCPVGSIYANVNTDTSIKIFDPSNLDDVSLNCQSHEMDERIEPFIAGYFYEELSESFKDDSQDNEWSGRPYAALIAACVSSIIGQNRAAIQEIDSWLAERVSTDWYDLRMKTALASLMEYWLEIDDIAGSDTVLQEYHLGNLNEVVSSIRDMLDDGVSVSDFNLGNSTVESSPNIWNSTRARPTLIVDSDHLPRDYECPQQLRALWENEKDPTALSHRNEKANLEYTSFTYMLAFIERAFKQPDFESSVYVANVKNMLEELNTVEFGCLPLIVGHDHESLEKVRSTIAYMRAQIYRFNALWVSYEYAADGRERSKAEKQKMLGSALKIANEGLFALSGPRETESKERDRAANFREKVKASNIQQEYAKLLRLKRDLTQTFDQLGSD